MLTGTPLDLTPFGSLLKGAGALYWVVAFALVLLVLWQFKRWWLKLGAAVAVLSAFVVPAWHSVQEQQGQDFAARAKLAAAKAHFETRCKSAGDVIRRTAVNVDGIVLLKVPPKHDYTRVDDPTYPAAARFGEPTDDWYIRSWLRWPPPPRPARIASAPDVGTRPVGYEFVEVIDQSTSTRYRYRLVNQPSPHDPRTSSMELVRERTTAPRPRYGVTYEDVIDSADRAHWIAGDVFQIIDLETKEVIAERARFLWDTGLGNTGGFRQPWPWASGYGKRCPPGKGRLDEITPMFVHLVLIPTKEE